MPGLSPELGQEPIDIPSDHSSMDDSDSDSDSDTSTERSFYISIDPQISQAEPEDDEMQDRASLDGEDEVGEVQSAIDRPDEDAEGEPKGSQEQESEIELDENVEKLDDFDSSVFEALSKANTIGDTDCAATVDTSIDGYPLMERLNSVVRMHIWKYLLKLPTSDKGWTPNEVSHISQSEPRMLKASLVINKEKLYEPGTRHLKATLKGRQITTGPINQFLAITQVNKELRPEAMRIYFNINKFHFDDPITLQNFILCMPKFSKWITRLSFSYVPPLHKTIAFKDAFRFLHATNLMHFDLHIDEMAVMSRGDGYPSVQKMPGMPELHRLRGIQKLRVLGSGGEEAKKPASLKKSKIRVDRQEQEHNWRTKQYLSIVEHKIGCKADQGRADQKDLRRPRSEPLDLMHQLKEIAKASSSADAVDLRDIVKQARQDRKDAERDAKERKAKRDKDRRDAERDAARLEREEEKAALREEKAEQREIARQAREAKQAREKAEKQARAAQRQQDRDHKAAAKQAAKDLKALEKDRERRRKQMAATAAAASKGKKSAKVRISVREDTDDSEDKVEESSADDASDPDSDLEKEEEEEEEEPEPPKKKQKQPAKKQQKLPVRKKTQLAKRGRKG